eukprot:TRINITY_DN14446_c0_g1_i1.p1 TRINITY_DN14446_c0_g1~~TRINITY_DN14446_c0_g1_i1.p1  ORF type:complete len:161 (+),score=27.36 TRINITY_DN14446_c0_g1_i1:215-697(+)
MGKQTKKKMEAKGCEEKVDPALFGERSAVVPYRLTEPGKEVEVLLVTSSHIKGRLGYPGGQIDPGETPSQAAVREAEEEAGAVGILMGKLRPTPYHDPVRKLDSFLYLLKVTDEKPFYMEQSWRDKKWYKAKEALTQFDSQKSPYFRKILEDALELISKL